VGDQIYIYNDSKLVTVFKIDTTTPYAHVVYVFPFDQNYTIQIYGGQPMLPTHVQLTTGFSDNTTTIDHSEWETTGYLKTIAPWAIRTGYQVPVELGMSYKDILQFPIIFDTVNGALIDSWDLKAAASARERMIMAENIFFFTGEVMTNVTVNDAAYTNKYTGFEGFLTSIFYGGGNIREFDDAYGFDLDVDYRQIILQNDALKLSEEYLMLCPIAFRMGMETRVQDAFKGNSGSCTFETFERSGDMRGDIKRLGVDSYRWLGKTLHIKEVGAWSDSRWIGNAYFKNMGIMMPGTGLTDSNGQAVNPVEYWMPKGQTEGGMWAEYWQDHRKSSDRATKISGDIYHQVMMSVNAVENMFAIMPTYL
jgi:hypothetical protein